MKSFLEDYAAELAGAVSADFRDNHDAEMFGPEPSPFFCLKDNLRILLNRCGLTTVGAAELILQSGLKLIATRLADLEWLYAKIGDETSKKIMISLVAYRALGHRRIKLPVNTAELRKLRNLAARIPHGVEFFDVKFLGWKLQRRSLDCFGFPIEMFTPPDGCLATFGQQQYRCITDRDNIECSDGDYVIDAGGCYGDTALYFAHKAGAQGRVASFEFLPAHVSIFQRNMELNPVLAQRIHLYQNPLFSEGGRQLFVVGNGPASRVVTNKPQRDALAVTTVQIDNWMKSGDFKRIDFIKMDIEGAELEALKGAEKVLRRFRPKLAITVYHNFEDLWTIPRYLDRLSLGYRFFLRHFTIHLGETVLFATCE